METKEFIIRQLATAGWAPIDARMALFLEPGLPNAYRDMTADARNPNQVLRAFPGTTIVRLHVNGYGHVPILTRSELLLAERIGFMGFEAILATEEAENAASEAKRVIKKAASPTTGDALALRHVDIATKEAARPCKACGRLSGGGTCMSASEIGAPNEYRPDTAVPRKCLAYAPPRTDRDEILRYDRRTGRELWPEVVTAIEGKKAEAATEETAIDRAKAMLASSLAEGPKDAAEIIASAATAGISARTMHRAADALGVVKEKAGFEGGWVWRLGDAVFKEANPVA